LRRDGRIRKAQEHRDNLTTFEEIEDELAAELEARKASQAYTKELRGKKKLLQVSAGIKKRRNPLKAAKAKGAVPLEPAETVQPGPADDAMETVDKDNEVGDEVDMGLMVDFVGDEADGTRDDLPTANATASASGVMGCNTTDLPVPYLSADKTLAGDEPIGILISDTTALASQPTPVLLNADETVDASASASEPTPVLGTDIRSSMGRSQRIRTAPKTFGEAATTEFSDVETPKRPKKRRSRKQSQIQ
jgi:hypothetical protein